MTPSVFPALLALHQDELSSQLALVETWNTPVHIDIMDGRFVTSTSVVEPEHLAIYPKLRFELHLMVENPIGILEAWGKRLLQTDRVLIHTETDRPIGAILAWTREHAHLKRALVLNPETPTDVVRPHIDDIEEVMCMGVHPGASRQAFLGESILEKIRWLRREYPQLKIGVDGGITPQTLVSCAEAGASRFRVGSSIMSATDPLLAFQKFSILARRVVPHDLY